MAARPRADDAAGRRAGDAAEPDGGAAELDAGAAGMTMGQRPLVVYRRPWRIELTVRPDVPVLVPRGRLARAIAAALDAAGAPAPASVGVVLADDAELARLNEAHMGAVGPTDVLSFPLLPPTEFPPHEGQSRAPGPAASTLGADAPAASPAARAATTFRLPPGVRTHLGDIVVSVERAAAQAEAGRGGQTGDVRWTAAQELLLLVTHGTLHLCGWDHAEPDEERAMRALEARLLEAA
ncbi:MAG TPA: rRNA maturation RNase YbeY [Candidatus Limnocylindrales bacterium]